MSLNSPQLIEGGIFELLSTLNIVNRVATLLWRGETFGEEISLLFFLNKGVLPLILFNSIIGS
jgi:hypothetical protein